VEFYDPLSYMYILSHFGNESFQVLEPHTTNRKYPKQLILRQTNPSYVIVFHWFNFSQFKYRSSSSKLYWA